MIECGYNRHSFPAVCLDGRRTLEKLVAMNTVPKILVVDDDSRVRKFLTEALNHIRPESQVLTAEDGVDALTKLTDVDMVITDCIMPKMDGIQLCNHIRRLNKGIKVVLVTGKVPYAEIPHDMFDDILMKPFTVGDIEQTIKNLLPHQGHPHGRRHPADE